MSVGKKIAVAGAAGRVGHHVVDIVAERGHDVVPMSRTYGVDVISKEGLAEALAGVECIVDTATGPSPEQRAATEFFTTVARGGAGAPRPDRLTQHDHADPGRSFAIRAMFAPGRARTAGEETPEKSLLGNGASPVGLTTRR